MSWNYGFKPTLIDIGGGFSSTEIFDLGPIPEIINNGLALYFPETTYEYIAEPGRYFFEHVATLVTPVIGMKGTGVTISESLYGAFNCVLFDHAQPTPSDFIMKHQGRLVDRMLFGNTCDGGDCISKNIKLPENLEVDDWIVWPRMGAYTFAATTTFNGFKYNERYGIYV